jgi:hypothetical protein
VVTLRSLKSRARILGYVAVGIVAFSLGGATVVQAVAPGGILGIVRLADGTVDTQLAAVDSSGNLAVKVSNFPAAQNVTVSGGTINTAPPMGRTVLVLQDQDVEGRHRVQGAFLNVSDCRSMVVFIDQNVISPVSLHAGLMLNGDGGSEIQTLTGGTRNGSVFFFNVPGTSMPIVAPFARVFVDNETDDTAHFDRVWLYCSR